MESFRDYSIKISQMGVDPMLWGNFNYGILALGGGHFGIIQHNAAAVKLHPIGGSPNGGSPSPIGVSPNGVSPNGVSPIGGSPIGGSPIEVSPNGGPKILLCT